jgi:hypothetical protein
LVYRGSPAGESSFLVFNFLSFSMKTIRFQSLGICLCLGLISLCNACHKGAETGGKSFESSFKETRPEVKEFAQQAVAAEEKKDFGTAFVHYRALSLNPDLTPEQRSMANDSMVAMNQKLREASTNGDSAAKGLLELYHATK